MASDALRGVAFPVKHRISQYDLDVLKSESNPISLNIVKTLAKDFLKYKLTYGTDIEKKTYASFSKNHKAFFDRLITKRPLTFMGRGDRWLLKNGNSGFGGFREIGTDKEAGDLTLENLISYDEMAISAFISMANSTRFYNNGNRQNRGRPDITSDFEPNGIYIAQVGARFEERFYMDWKFMIIDPEQNTRENGYGKDNDNTNAQYLKIWSKFYNIDYFPSYTSVARLVDEERYVAIPGHIDLYFDIQVFKKRTTYNALVFLGEANRRAREANKKAFCHVVGLGLGVWEIHPSQEQWTIEAYLEILGKYSFPFIDTLYFAWMTTTDTVINGISVKSGKREPAEKLQDESKLLVCNYAWDSNSYAGNEYWMGQLSSSGDPAAASCSTISYTQTPELNPRISSKYLRYFYTN